MATKMEVAATQLQMQSAMEEVAKGLANAASCMKGIQNMSTEQVGTK